jgi:hypothetical protein
MAATAAIKGYLADAREFLQTENGSTSITQFTLDGQKVKRYGSVETSQYACGSEFVDDAIANRPDKNAKVIVESIPKFAVLSSIPTPFDLQNINTDLIILGQYLKTVTRTELGPSLFRDVRYNPKTQQEIPGFVLNQDPIATLSFLSVQEKTLVVVHRASMQSGPCSILDSDAL